MATIQKIARMIKLTGILGLSMGSLVLSACRGKSPDHAGDFDAAREDAAVPDGGIQPDAAFRDAAPDATRDAAMTDGGPADAQPPDAQLWDVICE